MPFNFSSFKSGLGRLASGAGSAASRLATAAKSPAAQNLFSAAKGIGSALAPALAPQLGQMIGNKIGGNAGNMIAQMGQSFAPQAEGTPQEPGMGVQDYIQQGRDMGQNAIQQGQQMAGNAMTGMINRYVPEQYRGLNANNAGSMFGGMATNFLSRYLPQGAEGQPGLADVLGGMAGNYINQGMQRYVPQQYRDINIGDMGNYAAQRGADYANQGLDAAAQYAGQQAGNMGFAGGGSVGHFAMARHPYYGGSYGAPRLSLRDVAEMMPVQGQPY